MSLPSLLFLSSLPSLLSGLSYSRCFLCLRRCLALVRVALGCCSSTPTPAQWGRRGWTVALFFRFSSTSSSSFKYYFTACFSFTSCSLCTFSNVLLQHVLSSIKVSYREINSSTTGSSITVSSITSSSTTIFSFTCSSKRLSQQVLPRHVSL